MIPRHLLPYSLAEFVSVGLAPGSAPNAAEVEQAYARALGARDVLLFPSVRAAIYPDPGCLRIDASVVSPAYTCDVVHHALTVARARTRFLDSAPGSFLMSPEAIGRALPRDGVLLLSEVYGIPYDLDELDTACEAGCRLRIFDLAMRIPSPERIRRLSTGDAALYSFGWGKPLYAGWGGIACFQDAELADQTRRTRDKWMRRRPDPTVAPGRCPDAVVLNQRLPNTCRTSAICAPGADCESTAGKRWELREFGDRRAVRPCRLPPHPLPQMAHADQQSQPRLAREPWRRRHAELRRDQAETYWRLWWIPASSQAGDGPLPVTSAGFVCAATDCVLTE
jgi:hypothetical protein